MKAVILAAGGVRAIKHSKGIRYLFPRNSKPKCLFHVDGEVILARMVRCLRAAGINDIRVVTGYRHNDITKFNGMHELGLEIVYSPEWEVDAVSASTEIGLKDVADDVLLLFSDIVLRTDVIRDFLVHPKSLVRIKLKKKPKLRRGGESENKIHIIKVAKEKLYIFEEARNHMKRCLKSHPAYKDVSYGTGIALVCALTETLRRNEPVGEVLVHPPLREVDLFKQTDEGKKHLGIK